MLSVPFTGCANVGLIDAINMVDGADGLAGSLVLTALVMLVAACLYSGNEIMAQRVMIMVGAVSAFLWFNLRFPWRPHAKIFMGNAGSAFLGFVIAWVSFRLTQNPGHPVSPVLALWLIPVSYTHLDVYKRQGLLRWAASWRSAICLLYTSRCV